MRAAFIIIIVSMKSMGVVGKLNFSYILPVVSGAGIKLQHSIKAVAPHNYFYSLHI